MWALKKVGPKKVGRNISQSPKITIENTVLKMLVGNGIVGPEYPE